MRMSTHLQHIWPRSLSNQLALANSVILVITILGFAFYSASLQTHQKFETNQKQVEVFGKNIAALAEKYLRQKQQDLLEAKLYQLINYPNVNAIYIVDKSSFPLLAIRLRVNGSVISETSPEKKIVPQGSTGQINYKEKFTEFWFPFAVKDKNISHWVFIEYDANALEQVNIEIFKKSMSVAFIAILISLVILRKLLNKPMSELKKAAEFAEWIDMSQGSQIEVSKSSLEVQQLLRSLNRTSEKLHRQEENQKTSGILLDTIREIQSKFISENDITKVFESIVLSFIQLTKSEYGFFGEVMIDENNKSYLKMKAISNFVVNSNSQEFIDKYDIKNHRFYNFNNLFGAAIQAKKIVIANEAPNDPRRGGLPAGHPKINSFLGLPVFSHDRVVGIIGLANRKQGYDQGIVAYLQPLISTCAHMVEGNRNEENRKIVQDELSRVNADLEKILNSISDGIITVNSDGIIKFVNSPAATMFTNQTESMIGTNLSLYIEDLVFDKLNIAIHGKQIYMQSGNEKFNWRMTGRHKDGTRFPLEMSLSEYKQGNERCFVGTIHNLEQHAETNMLKEGFFASINDELREALATIRGSLAILSGNIADELNENALSIVGSAYKNTERLIQLFENVNDITKIESGEIELNMSYQSADGFVDDILSANQDICRKYNLTLVVSDTAENLLFCDAVRLQQVVRALILRAVEYCVEGDVIQISTKEQEANIQISIVAYSQNSDQEFHNKNRNKYTRLYVTSDRKAVDNDYDLHYCKAIVDHHNGKIGYEVQADNGAHFYIQIPYICQQETASNM